MYKTPFFLFDKNVVRLAVSQLQADLPDCAIYFCMKANGEKQIAETIASISGLFEVSSDTEFDTAIDSGAKAEDIICGLPCKPGEMIQSLYRKGCRYFIFDHIAECEKIRRLSPNAERIIRIDMSGITDSTVMFGASVTQIQQWIFDCTLDPTEVSGIALDVRKNTQSEMILKAMDRCRQIFPLFPNARKINLGGNFRMSWELSDGFYDRCNSAIAELRNDFQVDVSIESGRTLVKHAGRFYCKVILVKEHNQRIYVYVDGGKPSGITHAPTFVRNLSMLPGELLESKVSCDFFGPTCCHSLLFSADLPAAPREGDLLEFGGMGAYTVCQMTPFHGCQPTPIYYYDGIEATHESLDWPSIARSRWGLRL